LVFRVLLLAIVLGLSFELSGLAATLGDPACSADCPDDRSGGECPPNCHSCDCCSSPRTVTSAPSFSAPLPELRATGWVSLAEAPPSVDPSEILHVPKLLA
jgi:hypothetical protein